MKRRRMIYEGKAKILYEGTEPGTVIQYFKDDATAFDATKKGDHRGQGRPQQPHQRISDDRSLARSACRPISCAGSTCASS